MTSGIKAVTQFFQAAPSALSPNFLTFILFQYLTHTLYAGSPQPCPIFAGLLLLVLRLHCGKARTHLTALWVHSDSKAFCVLCALSHPWPVTGLQVCRAVRWPAGWEGPWVPGSKGKVWAGRREAGLLPGHSTCSSEQLKMEPT